MRSTLRLLAAVLGLPLLALVTATLTRSYATTEATQSLTHEALLAGGIGLLLSGAIWGAERLVKRHFALLWRLFAPLLWLTLATALLLVPLHAALLLHSIWAILFFVTTIRNELVLMATGFLLIGLALYLYGTVSAAFYIVWALIRSFRHQRYRPAGALATPETYPRLWELVRVIAGRLGCPPPDQIILLLESDLFVTEQPVWFGNERRTGRTMALSLSAMHLLTEAEFSAVIAHEMAHLGARDTALLHRYAPILHRSKQIYQFLAVKAQNTVFRTLGLLPAMKLLQHFHASFTRASSSESRKREYAADAASLGFVPARVIGAALVKLHAASETWGDVIHRFWNGSRPVDNGARLFAALARQAATPERIADLTGKTVAHPFDTHPSLHERLTALDLTLAAASDGIDLEPADAAIALVPDAEELEEALTEGVREWVRLTWNDQWWRYRGPR
ncbi:MAG TPA: M48 family metalloprotease [Symbiobacteriaceae bacterium]|nr:M48 family metalloprotease [Symbiobacteriaceae bacterium]